VSNSNFGPPPGNFNDDDSGPPRRGDADRLAPTRRPLVTALVVAAALLVVIGIAAQFWTEVLWYQSVGYTGVFSTQLVTKVLLGLVGGLLTAAMVWSSIHFAYRSRPGGGRSCCCSRGVPWVLGGLGRRSDPGRPTPAACENISF